MPRTRTAPGLARFLIADFSGGLNLRDAPSELGQNESPDCMNVTLDERGGVVKRLGLTKVNAAAFDSTNAPKVMFYSTALGLFFVQTDVNLWKTSNFSAWTKVLEGADTQTFTTNARCAMCDFNGRLVVAHPVDGVMDYDGATFTTRNTTAKGDCIAVLQNKVVVGGDPSNAPRIWWSNLGDQTMWTTGTDFNNIREKDDAKVTALQSAEGMDIQGRAGLLVFKAESTYRVNSLLGTTAGAFTTIDFDRGAAGPMSVVTLFNVTAAISKHGIFVTDGTGHMRNVSEKLEPLFRPEQLAFGSLTGAAAGIYRDRIIFSIPRIGSNVNNLTLEYNPAVGWVVPHSFGLSAMATYTPSTDKLYGGATSNSLVYEVFKGGSDDGTAITSRYQTRWFEPFRGMTFRIRRLRLAGRGVFSLYTHLNYATGAGALAAVSISGTGFVWGTDAWNVGVWGPSAYEGYQDFNSLGFARSVSFEFQHSGSSSATAPSLLDDGAAPEVGAFACYELGLTMAPIESG